METIGLDHIRILGLALSREWGNGLRVPLKGSVGDPIKGSRRVTVSCLVLSREWGNGSYSSPYIIPNNSLQNLFPHSLLRNRQSSGRCCC